MTSNVFPATLITGFHLHLAMVVLLMLTLAMPPDADARSRGRAVQVDKTYLRLAQSDESTEHDLEIVSIGSLALSADRVGHFDLTRIESVKNGDAYTLDFGGGYNYQGLYFSFGIALGRNGDTDENLFAYYPEVGLVLDVTNELAATISAKRYHRLYREDEMVVMIGLLVRQ